LSSGRGLLRTILPVIKISKIKTTPDLIIASPAEEVLVEVEVVKAKKEVANKITTIPAAITTTTNAKVL
jgi:hypothetical protein